MNLTPEQISSLSKGDPEIHAILTLMNNRISELEAEVRELKRRLGMNSKNSSKPPSSDGLRKPVNLRQKGGKMGAPKGHPGHTLQFVETPDHVVWHRLSTCPHCEGRLADVATDSYEKRQVFDLPEPRMIVIEYRAEKKCCPHCHTKQQAAFLDEVTAPVQYGPRVTAMTAYMNVYQLLPLERISRFYEDLTGFRPSEATLLKQVETMSAAVEPILSSIRQHLLKQEVLHADETGMSVAGKKHWLHTVSNAAWTFLTANVKRGSVAFAQMGVLPFYKSIVVHDCFPSYFREEYAFQHALCNAHLMRECLGIAENDEHLWPTEMVALLQESWACALRSRSRNEPLTQHTIEQIERRYDDILERGKAEWAADPIPAKTGPRGRKSKSKAANLGQRFLQFKTEILRFLRDARVPFDNNQAERDIRMCKVKEKISGTFRTAEGIQYFARIRSVISTLLKQQSPLFSSLILALRRQFRFSIT